MGRLAKLPPYLFSAIDAARRQALEAGIDVVDLGIGDPDLPTPEVLVEVMARAVRQAASHRYPASRGSRELRRAISRWFSARHDVQVDPERHVQVLIGSKEGLAHLPWALLEEGDEVLVPDPGYPVYAQATILAGGKPVLFPLIAERAFRPDWKQVAALAGDRTRLLYLNYPNNPTGAAADGDLFGQAIALGRSRGCVIAHDAAYLEVVLGADRPASLLAAAEIEQDRVIEFHSLSKMFNMTGWRIGFAVGHADIIRDLGRIKESIDSGVFTAIQDVAVFALGDACEGLIAAVMAAYPPRRAVILRALHEAGIEVFPCETTFYIWARTPGQEESLSFCQRVLDRCGVVLTPGVGFGPGGEGWFRISLTAPDEQIKEAAVRLRELGDL